MEKSILKLCFPLSLMSNPVGRTMFGGLDNPSGFPAVDQPFEFLVPLIEARFVLRKIVGESLTDYPFPTI